MKLWNWHWWAWCHARSHVAVGREQLEGPHLWLLGLQPTGRFFSKLSMCKSWCFYPSKYTYRYMIYYDISFLSYVTNINQYLCQLSNQVEKEIIAGSDFFLMPSRLENAKEKSVEIWTIWTMFRSFLKKADHFSREHTYGSILKSA